MTDRIDPGPGWRLLELREKKPDVYQWLDGMFWRNGTGTGGIISEFSPLCRVRVYREGATKAIATRATVRAVFPDGATIADSIACESGLSVEMMQFEVDRWALSKIHLPESGAKYIMLEIQREGEP